MPLSRRRPVLRAAAIGSGAYAAGKRRQEAKGRLLAMEMLERLDKLPPARRDRRRRPREL